MAKVVRNGRVWFSGGLHEAQVWIDDRGRVAALLAPDQPAPFPAEETIDAAGALVLPGGIDMHAHAQDGAETFFPATCAAAAGGITTLVDMPPFHTCTNRRNCESRRELASRECVIDFGLGGGIVVAQEDLKDLQEAAEFGVPYFKVFMPSEPPVDAALLWRSVQAAARTGLRLALHAEETACLEPEVDWNDPLGFAAARPAVAEVSAAAQVLEMARAAGAPLHICHVSAGRTAELIDLYRGWGADVTAETTPHYLIFDESEFTRQGARVKTTPPLRSPQDVNALWQALAAGVIDAVVSDHYLGELPTPGKPEPGLREHEAGIAGLEFSLPLLFDAGVCTGRISLERFVECTAHLPAHILGFAHRKGRIVPGLDADLVIFDPEAVWTASAVGPFSRAAWSPYAGRAIQGVVRRTLVRGETVWDSEKICVQRGAGQFVESRTPTSS